MQSLQKFNRLMVLQGRKRWMGCLLSVICLLLSGCGGHSRSGVQLQLSTWGSAQEVAVLKDQLIGFEQTHPNIHVQLLHIPENYYQKLHILIAGGMAPDVIFTNSISFPIYAGQGVFKDLRPFLLQDQETGALKEAQFYPQALQAFTWKDRPHHSLLGAIPRDISDVVIFYNRNLLLKAGLSVPKPDWNWENFREMADRLTVDQNNDGDPDQFGFSFYATPPLFWLPFIWSAGGDLFSPDLKRFELDDPKAVAGLRYYADLRNKWHVAPKKVESGGASMSQLFLQQKVAMMISGRWSVPVLREQAKFQWDVATLPVGPSGQSRVGIDASGYAISARSPHPKESYALIRYLLSREGLRQVAASGLIVPARTDVAESEAFLAPQQAPAHGHVFLDAIATGVPTRTPPRWNEFSEELGLALEPVWDGQQDAAIAMKAVKPKLNRLLEVSP